jgi:hypothetical protein
LLEVWLQSEHPCYTIVNPFKDLYSIWKICIRFERFVLHIAGLYFSYCFLEFGKKIP